MRALVPELVIAHAGKRDRAWKNSRKAQRPGLVMAAIYRTLLREIARDGFLVLDRRTSLTPLRKVWLAGTTWLRA
jgi:phytoene synthase